jgi:uncharacterized protein (DUF1501 family)
MFTTRRAFLKTSGLVALGLNAPVFLSRTAAAAPPSAKPGAKQTILVVVELTGGNDGLNTVIPFTDPLYAKYRPTLKQPVNQIRKLNGELGVHPVMGELADLFQQGELAVVQGTGYPNPDQSHFRSMDIWQAASLEKTLTEGWLGKAMKKMPSAPSFHLKTSGEISPLAFDGAPAKVPSIATLADYQLHLAAASAADGKAKRAIIEDAAKKVGGRQALLEFVQKTAADTYDMTRRLEEIGKNYQPKVPYPQTGLANRLKVAAQLIDADLGARVFYVRLDGFDTHSSQANQHSALLTELSGAMSAFYRDLSARGHKDRLCVMTFSEFGRRARENGSKGTDHGSAAPMFLLGGRVQGGIVGVHPSLEKLEIGNLKHHTDFRQVYAAVLDRWLGVSSKEVLGAAFEPVSVFKG